MMDGILLADAIEPGLRESVVRMTVVMWALFAGSVIFLLGALAMWLIRKAGKPLRLLNGKRIPRRYLSSRTDKDWANFSDGADDGESTDE